MLNLYYIVSIKTHLKTNSIKIFVQISLLDIYKRLRVKRKLLNYFLFLHACKSCIMFLLMFRLETARYQDMRLVLGI